MKNSYVKGVVFDWAGTTVDYGCIAPVKAFVHVFEKYGVPITMQEAREPMGLAKRDHVVALLSMKRIAALWKEKTGAWPGEPEINALYSEVEPAMAAIAAEYTTPIKGAVELCKKLKDNGIKIGATTGYVDSIMKNIIPAAKKQGFEPDAAISSSDVKEGRPKPWMCYLNAIAMDVYPMHHLVKIGDTVADIQEGLNAGMWTIGVTVSGNELGLSPDGVEQLHHAELKNRIRKAEDKLINAGAHFVVDGVWDCWEVIEKIEKHIANRDLPMRVN
jgi:phosphonoacetaldehyde hydrolase